MTKEKIWQFADENIKKIITPYEILEKYADLLEIDTDGLFKGEIIQTYGDNMITSLYIVVPLLKRYSLKLITITASNYVDYYPVNIEYHDGFLSYNSISESNLEDKIIEYIQSDTVKNVLSKLKSHIHEQNK